MTAPDELTPWTPGVIARAVEAHHWPPPTYWIRDMLEGIATAWTADLENLCIVRKTVKAQRDVVISQEARIEALERVRRATEVINTTTHEASKGVYLGKPCAHGNLPVYPTHARWCDECWQELEDALMAALCGEEEKDD